jgi:hypothetical protein
VTKGNIENRLSYVDQKYQAHFLELMQNTEILISEETVPIHDRQVPNVPSGKKIIISNT